MNLQVDFFDRNPIEVAKDLLGHHFVHKTTKGDIVGIITETEAYGDQTDLASHISRGVTNRNKIMLEQAGLLYVYHIYGIFYLTNIICDKTGKPGAVLIRSAEIITGKDLAEENLSKSKFVKKNDQLATGPGKFSLAFDIDKNKNWLDTTNSQELFVSKEKTKPETIIEAKRIGVDYAEECKDYNWRFYAGESKFISKKIGH